jgi:hypothetical protein
MILKRLLLDYNSKAGAPAFLLALGLCCYTEYWGKGIKKNGRNNNKKAFNAFLRRLDSKYYRELIDNDVDFYHDIWCGLAHTYLIEAKGDTRIITDYRGLHGIEYNQASKDYTFCIRTYFDEFANGQSICLTRFVPYSNVLEYLVCSYSYFSSCRMEATGET